MTKNINERGNYQGQFSQGVGGWAEYQVLMTEVPDKIRHDVKAPPKKVIPIIFLPGIMGSNLRMTKTRQQELKRPDNKAWRPDDLTSARGGASILFGGKRGGFFSSATASERQLNFDPNETEIDYYHYTEDKARFDPDGTETKESDKRHSNVPDGLGPIPPLVLGSSAEGKKTKPAQIARWRGWSEIMFGGAYGNMLKKIEFLLNNILLNNDIHPCWQKNPKHFDGTILLGVPHRDVMNTLLQQPPSKFGAITGEELNPDDIRKIGACWYPVHAMGYNFLKSNGESAKVIAERIRGLVNGYRNRHFNCDEVIIITHSMGGILARAVLHPEYGNLINEKSFKILGIYHSAMPTTGAGATYKRMRFGFQESWALLGETGASIFGVDGEHATAVLANASGPLELLPGEAYGKEWLKVVNWKNEVLWSWPRKNDTALDSIYLKPHAAWWRLVNPDWINPARVPKSKGGGIEHAQARLERAFNFVESIKDTFHPKTFASYCTSVERPCYGEVIFRVLDSDPQGLLLKNLPPIEAWKLENDNKIGTLTVQAGGRKLTLRLIQPNSEGDETVPGKRSASQLPGNHFVHGRVEGKGYEHQNSYSDNEVQASLLYSIVQIAKTAKWN
ncbi:esterase/lipase family protein [Pseudoduganella lutea]|uniref:GPI inositol-deacylase PGAP1-like alpha/beta domain-containing protein n=1 Tax=Pseudoduganella lutea TaxID=321985 RepID=A0A4P6KWD3_9BURK|nr:hypothetical protein [Pseudoduganella lutea]QBE63216.1 hypothetical protein EWM63_09770 [Pseudoduganella lutea]